MRYQVRMAVTLKPEVLDPAGQATTTVIQQRGNPSVRDVRLGKLVDLVLDAQSEAEAIERARTLGQEFLANPVLERFEVWVVADAH